jgi:DNA-binding transcriptional MerR regulator
MSKDIPRYSISEVSEMTDVAIHLLRQWEDRFPQLRPKRDRRNQRYYLVKDIEVVRRIKQLLRHDKLTTQGAVRRLSQELYGEGLPQTGKETQDLIDKIAHETRAALEILDRRLEVTEQE